MDEKRKLYLVYEYDFDRPAYEDVVFDEYLKLTKIFINKEDARKYLLDEFKFGVDYYSAIIEYNEGSKVETRKLVEEANFTKMENSHIYLIDGWKKKLLK